MECEVCHQFLAEESAATCNVCGRKFHLRSMQSQDGNCGYVWMLENRCGLAVMCVSCFQRQFPSDNLLPGKE